MATLRIATSEHPRAAAVLRTLALVFAAVFGVGAVSAAPASAAAPATYDVSACAASSTKSDVGWVPSVRTGEPIEIQHLCNSATTSADGDVVFTRAESLRPQHPVGTGPTTTAAAGRVAGFTLTAPAGSTLTHISYRRRLQSTDPNWAVRLSAGSQVIDDCVGLAQPVNGKTGCADTAPGGVFTADLPAGTTSLDLAAVCVNAPCTYADTAAYTFAAAIYSATVTVADQTAPSIDTDLAFDHVKDGWLATDANVTAKASDAAGLRALEIVENGVVVAAEDTPACVDASPTPCADPKTGKTAVSVKHRATEMDVPDGTHTFRIRATDAAGNVTLGAPVTVKVDMTTPEPVDFTVGGGIKDEFHPITWSLPTGGSPLVSAVMTVCDGGYGQDNCHDTAVPLAGPYLLDLSAPDSYVEVYLTLTDLAGNQTQEEGYAEVERDAAAPKSPSLTTYSTTGPTRVFAVGVEETSDAVEIRPRLCQGGACTDLPVQKLMTNSVALPVTVTAPGDYRLEVSAADGHENVSAPSVATFNYSGPATALVTGKGGVGPAGTTGGQLIGLTSSIPAKLKGSTILVRGTVKPGSASLVSVSITGRLKNKKSTTAVKAVKPNAAGAFAVRLRLASKLDRKTGVLLTIAATPNAGYAAFKVRKRVKG